MHIGTQAAHTFSRTGARCKSMRGKRIDGFRNN